MQIKIKTKLLKFFFVIKKSTINILKVYHNRVSLYNYTFPCIIIKYVVSLYNYTFPCIIIKYTVSLYNYTFPCIIIKYT